MKEGLVMSNWEIEDVYFNVIREEKNMTALFMLSNLMESKGPLNVKKRTMSQAFSCYGMVFMSIIPVKKNIQS